MTEKFELYFNDLTEAAQKRLVDFDPGGIPDAHLASKEPLMSMRSEPESTLDRKTIIREMLEKVIGQSARVTGDVGEMPSELVKEALLRVEAGEDVAGIVQDKRDGSVKFLTKAEALKMVRYKDEHPELDHADCSKCDKPDCEGRDAGYDPGSTLGSHTGPRNWN